MKQPLIIPINKKQARVVKSYPFVCNKKVFLVPKDYSDYDGCTGGNFILSLVGLSRFGYGNAASLPHDYIYVNKGHIKDIEGTWYNISRKDADKLDRDILKKLGYSKWTYWNVYWVIRLVGYFYWKRNNKSILLNILNKWN